MVTASSVFTSRLVRIWKAEYVLTMVKGSRVCQPNSAPPGRTMMSVPTKPPATSTQRRRETRSPSSVAASRVTTSGVIMAIAVNSPSGMYFTLRKVNRLVTSSSAPRSSCAPRRRCGTARVRAAAA